MITLDPHHFLGHWVLGMQRDTAGAHVEAVAAMGRARELSRGSPFTVGFLALVSGRAGRAGDVRSLLAHAAEAARSGYVPPSTFASGQIGLANWEDAFAWLNGAIDGRDPLVSCPSRSIRSWTRCAETRAIGRYSAR